MIFLLSWPYFQVLQTTYLFSFCRNVVYRFLVCSGILIKLSELKRHRMFGMITQMTRRTIPLWHFGQITHLCDLMWRLPKYENSFYLNIMLFMSLWPKTSQDSFKTLMRLQLNSFHETLMMEKNIRRNLNVWLNRQQELFYNTTLWNRGRKSLIRKDFNCRR